MLGLKFRLVFKCFYQNPKIQNYKHWNSKISFRIKKFVSKLYQTNELKTFAPWKSTLLWVIVVQSRCLQVQDKQQILLVYLEISQKGKHWSHKKTNQKETKVKKTMITDCYHMYWSENASAANCRYKNWPLPWKLKTTQKQPISLFSPTTNA